LKYAGLRRCKKFQKFPLWGLQDINVLSDSPFFGPTEHWEVALYKITFVWKNVQNGSASLDSFFRAS